VYLTKDLAGKICVIFWLNLSIVKIIFI